MDEAAKRPLSQAERGGHMLVAAAFDCRLEQCLTLKLR
jgi:hypothetical protein